MLLNITLLSMLLFKHIVWVDTDPVKHSGSAAQLRFVFSSALVKW